MRKLLIGYFLCGVVSWFLISGWEYADLSHKFPSYSVRRENAGFSTLWGTFEAIFWPVGLPITYCITGFAEHGWKPVWEF